MLIVQAVLLSFALGVWVGGPEGFGRMLALIHQAGVAILDHFFPRMLPHEQPERELGWVLRQYNQTRPVEVRYARSNRHPVRLGGADRP